MNFGVVVFPGSNCDDDMMHVIGTVLKRPVKKLWHKSSSLDGLGIGDCIVVPGGFSFGDYLRAGAIARFSPVMSAVIEFANKGGLVFGICNGFQILCEAGLLPGVLLRNQNQKFIGKNIFLKTITVKSPLTCALQHHQILHMPIAHAEGRYYADPKTIDELKDHDQILFKYCDAQGQMNKKTNVNGSIDHIAGICNRQRNVFGMMPHPERAAESDLGSTDGIGLFNSILSKAIQYA